MIDSYYSIFTDFAGNYRNPETSVIRYTYLRLSSLCIRQCNAYRTIERQSDNDLLILDDESI